MPGRSQYTFAEGLNGLGFHVVVWTQQPSDFVTNGLGLWLCILASPGGEWCLAGEKCLENTGALAAACSQYSLLLMTFTQQQL